MLASSSSKASESALLTRCWLQVPTRLRIRSAAPRFTVGLPSSWRTLRLERGSWPRRSTSPTKRLPECSRTQRPTQVGEGLSAEALSSQVVAETLLGRATAAGTAIRALELQDAAQHGRVLGQPLFVVTVRYWWTDELAEAHEALLHFLERARELGDESSLPYVLVILGQVEVVMGKLEAALVRAVDGQEGAGQSGQNTLAAYHLALEGLVEAQRGRIERARAAAMSALELVPETGGRAAELVASRALGHLELSVGAPDAALAQLEPSVEFVRQEGIP